MLQVVLMHKCSTQLLRYKKCKKKFHAKKLRFNEYKNTCIDFYLLILKKKTFYVCFQLLNHIVIVFPSTYFSISVFAYGIWPTIIKIVLTCA